MRRGPFVGVLPAFFLVLIITSCGGGGGGSPVTPPPVTPPQNGPSISSVSPSTAPAGGAGFTLTVTGANFARSANIAINGIQRLTGYVSSTQLTTTINPSDIAAAGTLQVTVVGGLGTSSAKSLQVVGNTAKLSLAVNQLVFDSNRQKIYASVGARDTAHGNTIAVINPQSNAVESAIPIGSEPNPISLSQDGKYLYVGVNGDKVVKRIDLSTMSVDLTFPLGTDPDFGGPLGTEDLAVVPGNSDALAVVLSRGGVDSAVGVAIFDHGVRRPNIANENLFINRIAFGNSPGTLYGSANGSLMRMTIDADGIAAADHLGVGGFAVADIFVDGGLIYTTDGVLVDPSTSSVVGTFSGVGSLSVVPDAGNGRAYFLRLNFIDGSPSASIVEYDKSTFLEKSSVNLDTGGASASRNLIRCGGPCFAFTTDADQVILTSDSLTSTGSTAAPTLANLYVKQMVYDSSRGKIYASVPGSVGSYGNSIAVINPETSAIEKWIYVGSEPKALAISDDDQFLYVGLDGAAAIQRVDLATQTLGIRFDLRSNLNAEVFALNIAVMPGAPDTVAVALRYDHYEIGAAIYDSGVIRGSVVNPGGMGMDFVFFSGPVLYGYTSLGDDLLAMTISATGLTYKNDQRYLVRSGGYYLPFLTASAGRLYAPTGKIVDLNSETLVADLPLGDFGRGFAIDENANRLYLFMNPVSSGESSFIAAFDKTKFVLTATQTVPDVDIHAFLKCGSKFAYALNDHIDIVDASFTAAPTLGTDARTLPVNHMVYDSTRQKIYASLSGVIGPSGNSIATIDPKTASIESTLFVGSEPNTLAISKDGTYLYVGLDGDGTVHRLNLSTGTDELDFSLGMDPMFKGPRFADYIQVDPTNSTTIAISQRFPYGWSPRFAGIVIYDNDIARTQTISPPFEDVNSIAFGSSASQLYGYDNETTGFEFYRMHVDGNGVSIVDKSQIFGGFYVDILYDSGLIYSTNGDVVDPVTNTLVGKYPGVAGSISVLVDDTAGRVYFLNYDNNNHSQIFAFDKATYAPVGVYSQSPDKGYDLIEYGSGQFAFATPDGHIYFVTPTFTPAAITTSGRYVGPHTPNGGKRSAPPLHPF